ncbi:MAG: c-type cytochrome [Terriglobales bacterium]
MRLCSHRGWLTAAAICLALGLGAGLAAQQAASGGQQASEATRSRPGSASSASALASLPTHRAIMGLGKLAPAAEIAQGKTLFETSCSFCHGADARGGIGPDLLESPVVLDDVNGDKIGQVVGKGFPPHMPSFQFDPVQVHALAAFLHSRVLEVANLAHGEYRLPFTVTGNAAAGKAYFDANCASCHSVTGDLAHIGSRYQPLQLQNLFLSGINIRSFFRRGARPVRTVTVTLPSGQTLSGKLRYLDEFNVVWVGPGGRVHSLRRVPGMKVQVADPLAAHQALLAKYTDADIHNVTAYLVTLK